MSSPIDVFPPLALEDLVHRFEARTLALEHMVRWYAGDELGDRIIDSINAQVGLIRMTEPPEGYTARKLLEGWRVPT